MHNLYDLSSRTVRVRPHFPTFYLSPTGLILPHTARPRRRGIISTLCSPLLQLPRRLVSTFPHLQSDDLSPDTLGLPTYFYWAQLVGQYKESQWGRDEREKGRQGPGLGAMSAARGESSVLVSVLYAREIVGRILFADDVERGLLLWLPQLPAEVEELRSRPWSLFGPMFFPCRAT